MEHGNTTYWKHFWMNMKVAAQAFFLFIYTGVLFCFHVAHALVPSEYTSCVFWGIAPQDAQEGEKKDPVTH